MAEGGDDLPPLVNEIADLLDQCSVEELDSILEAIDSTGSEACSKAQHITAVNNEPVPPAGPPPSNGSRRPVPAGFKRSGSGGEAALDEAVVSVGEMKKLLEEHSAGVLDEVRKLVNFPEKAALSISSTVGTINAEAQLQGSLNLEMLTQVLTQRDQEVKELEASLAGLQDRLLAKDSRVMELNSELEVTTREVRHRSLDLEFQQLKLEERMRSNKELELAHRSLTARVEDVSREARHAALDIDLGHSPPRTARVQGSLPWMLRKSRPTSDAWGSP